MGAALTGCVRALASLRLTIVLIVAIIAFVLVGTVVPQQHLVGKADLEAWRAARGWALTLVDAADAHAVFISPAFLATVLLLAVNTICCLALRCGTDLVALKDWLALRTRPTDKGIARSGFYLLHLSILVILGGGIWGGATRLDARVLLTEGQSHTDRHDNYLQIREGRFRGERHHGHQLSLQAVHREYADSGHLVRLTVDLTVAQGEHRESGRAGVNDPFIYRDISYTLDETGFSPLLAVTSRRGRPLARSFVALKTARQPDGRQYRDVLPFLRRPVVVTLLPAYQMVDGKPQKSGDVVDAPMAVFEEMNSDGGVAARHYARLGETVMVGDVNIAFLDLRQWAALRVGADPGYPIAAFGLWLAVFAMCLRYGPELVTWWRGQESESMTEALQLTADTDGVSPAPPAGGSAP
jgi:hypothetical protein